VISSLSRKSRSDYNLTPCRDTQHEISHVWRSCASYFYAGPGLALKDNPEFQEFLKNNDPFAAMLVHLEEQLVPEIERSYAMMHEAAKLAVQKAQDDAARKSSDGVENQEPPMTAAKTRGKRNIRGAINPDPDTVVKSAPATQLSKQVKHTKKKAVEKGGAAAATLTTVTEATRSPMASSASKSSQGRQVTRIMLAWLVWLNRYRQRLARTRTVKLVAARPRTLRNTVSHYGKIMKSRLSTGSSTESRMIFITRMWEAAMERSALRPTKGWKIWSLLNWRMVQNFSWVNTS
jgi:hypothetical protein